MLIEKNNNTPINDCKMQISAYSMQGRRPHMEDFFDISYLMKPAKLQKPNEWPYEYFYLGVFDGHGGSHAASFAKENLLKHITKQWKFWSNNDSDVLAAIKKGFADTHDAMLEDMPNWTRTSRVLPSTAGTTASVLFIRNGKFYTGHVGDSRIVISSEHPETRNWRHEELTQDHKPENEIERIENAGGQVKMKIGVHRVVWKRPVLCKELEEKLTAEPKHPCYDFCLGSVASYPIDEALVDSYQTIPFLAIARSLGDFWSYNPDSDEYVVSPEPDVMCRPIDARDKCILLATDGLWNVMNSSQAVRFLQELDIVKRGERNSEQYSDRYFATDNFYEVRQNSDKNNYALSLVYMAYQIWERRRLRSDNITAIVAMLSDILAPHQSEMTAEQSKKVYTEEYINSNAFKLGQTRIVCQDVTLDKAPMFQFTSEDIAECETLRSLEDYLLFPPSILEAKSSHPFVEPPKNYFRLSNAKCRKLQRDDLFHDDETDQEAAFIYIKEVSDDPGDLIRSEPRKNSKNVEIRDSGAQATQSMHDFGQPWDQLVSDNVGRESKKLDAAIEERLQCVELPAKDKKVSSSNVNDDNIERKGKKNDDELSHYVEEDYGIVANLEDEEDSLDDTINYSVDSVCANKNHSDETDDQLTSHTIEQVLSVVSENRTPPVTRKSIKKSATENPKRKFEIEITASPKTKRRKSHPIHTVVAVTKT
jgi:protein phosphatase 1D